VITVLVAGVRRAVGLCAGYYGGRVDATLMRMTDATMSFPVILLALILAVTVGPSFTNVVVAIAVILWARFARVIRGQVLTLMQLDFIAQSRIAGAGA
jgi:peptide/nickel transport system permease protein